MVSTIGPSTLHTIATASAVRYPFQRKGFYARGYHFAFYVRANKLYWQRSADGVTWDGENDITPAGEAPGDGGEFSVWLDRHEEPAHHPHIVYADEDGDSPLYYRRGTIDSNGNLTWDAVWQDAVSESVGRSYRYPTICVDDTSGRPVVGYLEYYRSTPATSVPWVRASDAVDGTWNRVNTKQISITTDASWVTVLVPYQGVYIMALYTRHPSQLIKYDIYNFTSNTWAGEQSTGVLIGTDSAMWSVTSQRAGKAPSVRRVHVAYCDPNNRLQYISIDDGVPPVTGPVLIYNSNLAMGPAISTRIFGGDVNPYRTLYVFWTPTSDQPTQDFVAYAKSIDDGANWTNEAGGVGPQDWINETSGELAGTNIASVYFEEQHHVSLPEGYIGLLYTTEGASPEFIRFACLEFADPDEDLLCKFKARATATAELLGKFEAQATAELLGKAVVWNIGSAELLGNAIIRHSNSAELLGKTIIRHSASAELLGNAEIQQSGSAELLGNADIRNTGSAELLGKAIIRHSADVELLGKAIIRHSASAELLGNAEIQQSGSAELLGEFEVGQNSAELLGKFEVGQDSAELLGRFEAQAIAELLGKGIIRQSGSAELLVKAVIRHVGTPAELLGKGIIRHSGSAELLGKGIIRQSGSAELLVKAVIRHVGTPAELLGRFRTSTDNWIVQGVSVEAYIRLSIVI